MSIKHKEVGSFTWDDLTTGTPTDVWFKVDVAYTIAEEWLDVPEGIASLSGLQGYGNVYHLHQTMVRDASGDLQDLVEAFIAETDINDRSFFHSLLWKSDFLSD